MVYSRQIVARAETKGAQETYQEKNRTMSNEVQLKRGQKKYHLPVIGHFADKSVRFNSILQAEKVTGVNYNLIFEACIGKIYTAGKAYWEFERGNHYIKYKAYYLRAMEKLREINKK